MDAGPSYTVLRIKRKATEPPLSSLVIQDQDPSHPSYSQYGTPKRRRDVSYRPKARGIFKLADTVPDSWVGRGEEGEVLKERIKGLMDSVPGGSEKGKERETEQGEADEEATMNEPEPQAEAAPTPDPQPRPRTPPSASAGLQYRVVSQLGAVSSLPKRKGKGLGGGPNLPPVLRSYADVQAEEQAKSLFRFIDAQAVSSASPSGAGVTQPSKEEPEDPQMAAFQNMLDEYLTLERTEAAQKEAEDEYVYDLYYRDIRDASIAGVRAGDGSSATSIGALIGFSDLSPPSTPSSSEPEDEADEDSNDEDFYRNDYPEDEDADEDMEGFDDAFGSDEDGSENGEGGGEGEDDEGRGGTWGYRG